MVDQPAAPAPFVVGPDGQPIILQDLRWPFDELGARDVPRELPVARPDVQLTVSMLAAMRDGVPTLVQYDQAGRALATGDREKGPTAPGLPNSTNVTNVRLTPGTESLELKVPVFIPSGTDSVQVVGHDSQFPYLPTLVLVGSTATALKVSVDTAQDSSVDVTCVSHQFVGGFSVLTTLVKAIEEVTILGNVGQEPGVSVIQQGPQRPYDVRGFSGPAAGVAASLVFAADANKSHQLDMLAWSVASGGTAGALRLQVLDGATLIWEQLVVVQLTANTGDHEYLEHLGLKGTKGNSLTVQFTPALAGCFQEVAGGVYDKVFG